MTSLSWSDSQRRDVQLLPLFQRSPNWAAWRKRLLAAVFTGPVHEELPRGLAVPDLRDAAPPSDQYQLVLAAAEDLEDKVRVLNREIEEMESRLQRLAQFY